MSVIMIGGKGKIYAEGTKMVSEPANTGIEAVATPAVEEPKKVETTVLKVAGKRHAELHELLKQAAEGHALDVEFVHDLRVGTRRLGEVAAVLGVLMDKPTGRMVDASLKGLRKSAGELRDLDVACEHLSKTAGGGRWRMPAVVRHVAEWMVEEMRGRRGDLAAKLRESTRSAGVTGAMVLLARVIEDGAAAERVKDSEGRLSKELEARMARREKQLNRTFGRAAKKQTAEALHAARIAVKKLRYVMELADAGGVRKTKKDVNFLKRVQELLGVHHDVHVIEEMVGERAKAEIWNVKGLGAAWRKWQRQKEHEQAKRAGQFFMKSYAWMNGRG